MIMNLRKAGKDKDADDLRRSIQKGANEPDSEGEDEGEDEDELDENGEVNIITIRYILEKNSDLADNDNDTNDSTIDILELTYSNEFVYVSRACGFKSIFRLEPVIFIARRFWHC